MMKDIVGKSDYWWEGRTARSRPRSPTPSAKVFSDKPEAAMVVLGDFAPGVTKTTRSKPGTGFNVFDFPSIEGSKPSVVGGGDLFVEFKKSKAADAFLEYLTTTDAARDLGEARRVLVAEQEPRPTNVYPDEITKKMATRSRGGRDVPLRPVRPPARRLRRHAGSGAVQGVLGLRGQPEQHRSASRRRWRPTPKKAYGPVDASDDRRREHGAGGGSHASAGAREESLWQRYGVAAAFLAPALIFLGVWIVYPTIRTIIRSFYDREGDKFVGFDNYKTLFTTTRC